MIIILPFLLAVSGIPDGCQSIDKDYLTISDVAVTVPAFTKLSGDINLGYLPSSGAPRILTGADLQRIAKNRGLDLESLPDVCFARRTLIPSAEEIRTAMLSSLGIPAVKIEIASSIQRPVPFGEVVFPRDGLQASQLWNGYVLYGDHKKIQIWAKVRITAPMTSVVALINLPVGKPIRKNQVRLESCEDFPLDTTAARTLEEVVDYLPKSALKALAPIRKTQLERMPDVTKGDLVKVDVIDGATHLVFEGTAQSPGAKGSFIMIRNGSSGKDFRAQITGKDQAIVSIRSDGEQAQ
jgi:flagella basal body P-ring formation protein FlgA